MLQKLLTCFFIFTLFSTSPFAQPPAFKIVPLGVKGGIDESNLSAYMVADAASNNFICLDAGTLNAGIEKAIASKVFNIAAEQVLRKYIKGYFISHAHLDHIAGLIINSPDDSIKNIYANADCIETIKTHYFTWKSWANFADDGDAPRLNKYHYQVLLPQRPVNVPQTDLTVQAFPLSHSGLESTAFLVSNKDLYLLYLGDTGPDEIEKSRNLHLLWQFIAPLIKNKQLRAIMIEASFPDEQPDKTLFGHLKPKWLMREMDDLAMLTGKEALKGFNVIVTHVKPPQKSIDKIKQQIKTENSLGLHVIFPEQGKLLVL